MSDNNDKRVEAVVGAIMDALFTRGQQDSFYTVPIYISPVDFWGLLREKIAVLTAPAADEGGDDVEQARGLFTQSALKYCAIHNVAMTTGVEKPYPQDAAMRAHRQMMDDYRLVEQAAESPAEGAEREEALLSRAKKAEARAEKAEALLSRVFRDVPWELVDEIDAFLARLDAKEEPWGTREKKLRRAYGYNDPKPDDESARRAKEEER